MDQLVEATDVEYGATQDRAKGSSNLAANIFRHSWNSSAGSIATKVAPAIAAGCTVVINPSEMSAMQTEELMDAFHEAGC
jgi:aldehyde dehydrogenase (NAD+)